MSNLAIQNRYDGGNAEDLRTENTNEIESCDNLDIFSSPHKPTTFIDTIPETMTSGNTVDYALSDVDVITVAGTTSLVALGRASSVSNLPTFFRKSSASDITSNWQQYASGVNQQVAGSLVVFRTSASTDLRAYCLGDSGTAHTLQMFDGSATVSTIGTLTNTNYSQVVPRPFVHPEDNVLYFADGNIIGKYDGTTFTATAFTLPANKVVIGLTNYGTYLVILCRAKNGQGNSTMYFWGRDTSLTTLQQSIDLGSSQVNIVENIDNTLIVLSSKVTIGSYTTILDTNLITLRVYSGGAMTTVKKLEIPTNIGTALNILKQKVGDKVYFGFSNDTSLYVCGKNNLGSFFISHHRGMPTGQTFLWGFSIIADFLFIGYHTVAQTFLFARTRSAAESQSYTVTTNLKSTKNPAMIRDHRSQLKQLQAVQWMYTISNIASTVTLYYQADGGSYVSIATKTGVSGAQVIEAANEAVDRPFVVAREYSFYISSNGGTFSPADLRYRYDLLEQLT